MNTPLWLQNCWVSIWISGSLLFSPPTSPKLGSPLGFGVHGWRASCGGLGRLAPGWLPVGSRSARLVYVKLICWLFDRSHLRAVTFKSFSLSCAVAFAWRKELLGFSYKSCSRLRAPFFFWALLRSCGLLCALQRYCLPVKLPGCLPACFVPPACPLPRACAPLGSCALSCALSGAPACLSVCLLPAACCLVPAACCLPPACLPACVFAPCLSAAPCRSVPACRLLPAVPGDLHAACLPAFLPPAACCLQEKLP